MTRADTIKIIGGSGNPDLAQAIVTNLRGMGHYGDIHLVKSLTTQFSDGETRVNIEESVRDCSVYVIQPTCAPTNDRLMELCIILDGLKRATATHITAVIPYFGYARQDKKKGSREPITAKMVSLFIEKAGADRVMAIDLHAEQIQGFFEIPVDHLYAGPLLGDFYKNFYFNNGKKISSDDIAVVSPDVSGFARAVNMASYLGLSEDDVAVVQKRRPTPNIVEAMAVIGNVKGKRCLIVDDMMDTCGTIIAAADALIAEGATTVDVACTHPVLSGPGAERLGKAKAVSCVACLDTIPVSKDKQTTIGSKLNIVSCADYLAQAINCHFHSRSVSSLFKDWGKK